MQRRKGIAAAGRAMLAILIAAGPVAAQTVWPAAKDRIETLPNGTKVHLVSRLRRALVTDFFFGTDYAAGRRNVRETIQEIAKEDGFTVVVAADAKTFGPALWKDCQVIVANSLTNISAPNALNAAQRAGVQAFVEAGGGLFSMHGTAKVYQFDWPWYNEKALPIGHFYDHNDPDPAKPARIYTDSLHPDPITAGIAHNTLGSDQFLNFKNYITDAAPSARILLWVDDKTFTCARTCTFNPKGHAVAWTLPLGRGQSAYASFGHDMTIKDTWGANWKTFLRQSLYAISGYDTLAATALAPASGHAPAGRADIFRGAGHAWLAGRPELSDGNGPGARAWDASGREDGKEGW